MNDEIEITEENLQEVLSCVFQNPVFNGEVTDWESFIRHPTARAAHAQMRNTNAVVQKFAFYPPLREEELEGNVPGFYLTHREFWRRDKNTGESEKTGEGPMVLLANTVNDGRNGPSSVVTVASGQVLEEDPITTRVTIGPVKMRKNLITGQTKINIIRGGQGEPTKTQVTPQDHEFEVPLEGAGLAPLVERCMNVNTRNDGRGVIYGDTGNNQALLLLNIGDKEDVRYYAPSEDRNGTLKVTCYDNSENRLKVGIKLPIQQVCDTFGLSPNSSSDDFARALAHEPIAVYGKFGLGYPIVVEDIENDDERNKAMQSINAFIEAGWMVEGKEAPDGTKLLAINLTDSEEISQEIAGHIAYDIRQNWIPAHKRPDGQAGAFWELFVIAAQEGGIPWFDCQEHHFTYRRDVPKMNVKAGDPGVTNEDAFCVFLNQTGDGVTLRPDDPFAGKFDHLPGFDDVEDAAPPAAPAPQQPAAPQPTEPAQPPAQPAPAAPPAQPPAQPPAEQPQATPTSPAQPVTPPQAPQTPQPPTQG